MDSLQTGAEFVHEDGQNLAWFGGARRLPRKKGTETVHWDAVCSRFWGWRFETVVSGRELLV